MCKKGPLITVNKQYVSTRSHTEVTSNTSSFLLVSVVSSYDQREPAAKSAHKFPDCVNSYWNDWILPTKIRWIMVKDRDRTLIEELERLRWHLNIHHLFPGKHVNTLPFITSHRNVGNLHLCHRSDSSHAHLLRTDYHATRISFPMLSILTQPFPFFLPSFLKSKGHCLLVSMAAVAKPSLKRGTDRQTAVWSWTERGVWAYINWNKRFAMPSTPEMHWTGGPEWQIA